MLLCLIERMDSPQQLVDHQELHRWVSAMSFLLLEFELASLASSLASPNDEKNLVRVDEAD